MESEWARTIGDLPADFNAAEDLLAPNRNRRPDKPALIDHRGPCTYAGLYDRAARMAAVFERLGIEQGERVLLCLSDTRDFPTVFLGAIHAGIVPVPLNTLLTREDYTWILDNSGARAVFVSGDFADRWQDIAKSRPGTCFISSEGGPWADLEELVEHSAPASTPAPTHRDDVAFWLYTSGSTGKPKGAMHRQSSMRLTANLYGIGTIGIRPDDVILSVAKLFFAYGLGNALSFPFAAGATAIYNRDRPSPDTISELLVRHKVSVLGGVPTFFASWLAHPSCPDAITLPSLRMALSAGEALPAHIGQSFRARFGGDVLDGLGSTELLHIFVSQRPGSVRYGCTGTVVDGYSVRLVDEEGRGVQPGEIGNLQVCGPTAALAYWGSPEKSESTFCGDWTVTGDKYSIDAEGWLTYAGRTDDMLKVGGIYVSPTEVEEALASHPAVLEAAVVGRRDDGGLLKPEAYVVVHRGVLVDDKLEARLKTHVKSCLAPYKYPRWIKFVDDLPKTATGKIQRFRLREQG